jgi:small subunit ribosomal protein S6
VSERIYEILFIVDPNIGEPEVDALAAQVQGFIEREKGKVQKIEKWGKKRLSYLVKKQREGQYVLITADVDAAAIKEIERRMHVLEGILKFMTVRVDEDLKKAERRKAIREKEDAKKRSRPGRPAPAPASVPVPEIEGGQL